MDYALARDNMIEGQVRPDRVLDERVCAALGAVPREAFVPRGLRGVAYADTSLPLGNGRAIPAPRLVGRLLNAARVQPEDLALVVGVGSGYVLAVLAQLATTVVGLEGDATLVENATRTLTGLGVDNGVVVQGSLAKGLPDQAPFDVIVIAGGVTAVPSALRDQLAVGGRLVAVEMETAQLGRGLVITRTGDGFAESRPFDAVLPLLPGVGGDRAFRL